MLSSRYIAALCVLPALLFLKPVVAQNLVRNCDLEIQTGCPNGQGQIDYCKYWTSPGNGSTDYLHACNAGNFGVPSNQWGFQLARSGNAYANMISYYQGSYREYMQTMLACALQAGQQYEVSFFVSCADDSRYSIDGMGLQFSDVALVQDGTGRIEILGEAHIHNTLGQVLDDKDNWVEIHGIYTAQGGEQYITIGNFVENSDLTIETFSSWDGYYASYYIDDISVLSPEPMVDLGPDTVICAGESITYDFSNVCGNVELTWEDGSTDMPRTISQAGTYSISGIIGCTNINKTVVISNPPDPGFFLPLDTIICPNQIIDIVTTDNFDAYRWQDGSDQAIYSTDVEGQFWLQVTDGIGCNFYDTIMVNSLTEPFVYLGNDTLICLGREVLLDPGIDSAFHHFLWSDYSTGTTLMVSDSGEYWLQVANPCGDMEDDILIHTINCSPAIAAPNAFTPNGDGRNDVFAIKVENISNFRMLIYDRWGTFIYESNDIDQGWDGSINGSMAPLGAYVWMAIYDIRLDDGIYETKKIKGTVMLIH
jgi:gliding motility-associated-like protein